MEAAQAVEDNGSTVKGGEEFYEDIEAPKYVDFTAADHYNPDDRYWFCARVGCDQWHEQEIDLEEINKNFILRVMAARSPNVKLRNALTAKTMNTTRKCPLTAPSKLSRPRVSRLAALSSISRKLISGKETVRSANLVVTATPKPRGKNSTVAVGNALTTPRRKKRVLKPELFRSSRNPKRDKAAVVSELNNRMVAKALVFNSPKKALKKKVLVDTDASVRRICSGMKKLEINGGQRKPPSNFGASRKKLGAREVKSRVYDALKPQKCIKEKENDSLRRHLEKQQETEGSQICVSLVVCDGSSGESSDMEVDENSNRGSVDKCSVESSELFEISIVQDGLDNLRRTVAVQVEKLLPSSDVDCCNQGDLKEEQNQDDVSDGHHCENALTAGDRRNDISESGDKENASIERDHNEVSESDDKENTSALDDDNREQNMASGKNILGKQDKHGKSHKDKGLNEPRTDAKSAQGGKYSKQRPTNPKPFRLRTDERRVLKEANLEKKLLLAPPKETNSGGISGGSLQKKHPNKVISQTKEGGSHQKNEAETKREEPQPRTPNVSSQARPRESVRRRTKLPSSKGQFQRATPGRNPEMHQLSFIKETSSLKEATTKKGEVDRAIASGDRRQQPPTMPKEPNFHTVSVPKTCTKKWV